MADSRCACVSDDAKDCLALRHGREIPFGERHDAEECACLCHDEMYDEDDDGVSTSLPTRSASDG